MYGGGLTSPVDPLILVSALLVAALILLVLVIRYYHDRIGRLQEELQDSSLARRRAAETQDRWTRQWTPVLSTYPFDPRRFRFVGGPVDGIQFEDDRVVLVAFTGMGRPPSDPRVRDLVRAGRVEWMDVPLGGAAAPPGSGAAGTAPSAPDVAATDPATPPTHGPAAPPSWPPPP